MKTLEFEIRPKFKGDQAVAQLKKVTNELHGQTKATEGLNKQLKIQGSELDKINKKFEDFARRHETGFDRLKRSIQSWGRDVHTAFEMGPIRGMNKLQSSFEGAIGKVLNFKNAILGSAVGYGAYRLIGGALHAGQEQVATEERIKRLVGSANAESFLKRGNKLGLAAGIQGDDAARGLAPIFEAIQDSTEKGIYRGRKLSPEKLQLLRTNLLDKGGDVFRRLSALHSNIPSEDLGRLVAQAGSGMEGITPLLRALGLRKLSGAEKAKYKNQKIGNVLESVLASRGEGEDAFSAKQKTFGFQIASIKSQLHDTFGDVGRKAIESLNNSLGKGTTLAKKLEEYLASDKGQKMIKQLGDSLANAVKWVAELAQKIPAAFSWISEHGTLIKTILGGYGALRVGGGLLNAFGGGSGKALAGAAGITPVFVAGAAPGVMGGGAGGGGFMGKAAGVISAGAAGYAVGTYLDEKFKISDQAYEMTGRGQADMAREAGGVAGHRAGLKQLATKRSDMVKQLEGQGLSHGQAIFLSDTSKTSTDTMKRFMAIQGDESLSSSKRQAAVQALFGGGAGGEGGGGMVQVHTTLNVDGEKMGHAVTKHQVRRARRETGNE